MAVHEIDINIVTVAFHIILFNKVTAKQQKSSGSVKQYGLNLKIWLFDGKQVVLHSATTPSRPFPPSSFPNVHHLCV